MLDRKNHLLLYYYDKLTKKDDLMMKQKKYEKSPFAKKTYDGVVNQKTTIAYHPTKEFKKTLDKFFNNKFSDASNNEVMDQIVKDYFYRYTYEKGFYGKTLIALISTNDLNKMYERNNLNALKIIPIVVLDRYAKNYFFAEDFIDAELVEEFIECGAMIYDKLIKLTEYSLQETIKENCTGKLYDDFDNYVVLEIALNNNLDANFDGLYGYDNLDGTINDQLHVGVNIANIETHDVNAFGVLYYWYLDHDFNVKIKDIMLVSNQNLNSLLLESKYCDEKISYIYTKSINIGTDFEIRLHDVNEQIRRQKDYIEQLEIKKQRILKSIELNRKNDNDKSV